MHFPYLPPKGPTMLDKLIQALNENARLSNEEVAARVGCTAEEVRTALAQAEETGAIRGYRVITSDSAASKKSVVSLVEVGLVPERDRGFDRIAERIARFPEVASCALVSGAYDLIVQVKGESLQDVAMFVSERLATIEGVRSTRTHFVLKRYKEEGVLLFAGQSTERLPVTP